MEESKLKDPNRWFKCRRCQRYYKLKALIRHKSKPEPNPCRFDNGQSESRSNDVEGSDGPPTPISADPSSVEVEASQGEVPFSQLATQVIETKVEVEDPALVAFHVLLIAEYEPFQDSDVRVRHKEPPDAAEVIEDHSRTTPIIVFEVANDGEMARETLIEEDSTQERSPVPENVRLESQKCCSNQLEDALATTNHENDSETPEIVELVKPLVSSTPNDLLDIHQLPTQIIPTGQACQHEDGHGGSFSDTILSQLDPVPPTLVTSQSKQCARDSRILRRSQRIKIQKLKRQHSPGGVMKLKELPYKCSFCTKRFKTVERRFVHEQKRHPVFSELDPDFQMCRCPACPLLLFKTKCGFQRHFQKCHFVVELLVLEEEEEQAE